VKHPKLESTTRLEKFYKYLNYKVSSSLLFAGSFFFPILLSVLLLAAIIFTPYMLTVLYLEEKRGWVIAFSIMVILPAIIITILSPTLIMIALVPFYFFCFILRMEVKGWITEMRARNDLLLQKYRKAQESSNIDDWIIMR
jgi:hypothetical protein